MTSAVAVAVIAVAGMTGGAAEAAEGGGSFATALNGANVVSGGDADGSGVAFLGIEGDLLSYAIRFDGMGIPTGGVLRQGPKGSDGETKVVLFATRLLTGRNLVTGTVRVTDPKVLVNLREDPGGFSVDLANTAFPRGAVRGQIHGLTSRIDMRRALDQNFAAAVTEGAQIYACTRQPDGTFAFTQDDVRASLQRGIAHFFAVPGPAGPPEWAAPDGSAVTGRVLSRTPNGAGNIAELDLAATQAGAPGGLLSETDEILRLNTVGGLAPTGPCDPGVTPRAESRYRADYVFIRDAG
ncbi:hypothetical protein GCM10010468_67810 [Actinocorallia longicatena]|uniref:CHRD domain-containing protein n=1 Tax=Actinocorallia longicatena TaxID=111803 RepID=A0ABP6QKF1_9ACTN